MITETQIKDRAKFMPCSHITKNEKQKQKEGKKIITMENKYIILP